MKKEYTYLGIFVFFFAILVCFAVDGVEGAGFPFTTLAFVVGAVTSMAAGFMGMSIATIANIKTTYLCNGSKKDNFDSENALNNGFAAALQGG